MKKIDIPTPEIKDYIQQIALAASSLDKLEVAVRKFWGQKVNIYYQGKCTPNYYQQIELATSILNQGKWNLQNIKAELKNVVFNFYGGRVKMQFNFTRALPEMQFLNFRAFRAINPQLAFSISKNNRTIDIHFQAMDVRKEASYEA